MRDTYTQLIDVLLIYLSSLEWYLLRRSDSEKTENTMSVKKDGITRKDVISASESLQASHGTVKAGLSYWVTEGKLGAHGEIYMGQTVPK